MKQIAQYQDGRLELQDVPAPQIPPGGILVRTTHSVISPGTEKMKVEQAKMNLLQKAKARPDQVKKVLDSARTLGWKAALEKVRNRLETPTPLGYSAAGIVEAVHPENTRFQVGDRVAVAGAECAHHAEYVAIPDKLAAKVPAGVDGWQAAYTTMMAISLQGIRQADVKVGDRVLVIGQGLVGLLATAILKAAGARVIATDLDDRRLDVSKEMGAERVVNPRSSNLENEVREWTDGYGVDSALVCTAGSNAPIEQAAAALRDRGIMVIVGITNATLDWKTFFHKDIDVRFSRSYGPGRYDLNYEWGGQDYPIGYVRWTEGRNFDACLEMMRSGQVDLTRVTSRSVMFDQCLEVYEELTKPDCADIGVVLEYAAAEDSVAAAPHGYQTLNGEEPKEGKTGKQVSGLDVFGAGNFVKTMLLPHLKDKVSLGSIVTQTALSARHSAQKFGFQHALTDADEATAKAPSNAVLIGTRHHLHAPMVLQGLQSNRHVFVEKPLCLTREQLAEIDAAYAESDGTVMVGFNRRYAPSTQEVKKRLDKISGPKTVTFHVMCGKLDPEHWYANYEESGGRILGEACHFLDFFCYLIDSKPIKVTAQNVWSTEGRLPFPDSVTCQVEFEDGSCGQLIYTAEGDTSFPKEVFTVYAAGLVARCENFQQLDIHQGHKKASFKHGSKGHAEEMGAWAAFLRGEAEHPLPYAECRQSMHVTFGLLESIRDNCTVEL